MHTTSMQSFYATAASVAGALIGLLFVAVTVAHDRPSEDPRSTHQLPAAAALTAFTNTLCVSLFGLIEHGQVAIPAAGSGIAGMLFVLTSLPSLIRGHDRRGHNLMILGLLALTLTAQLTVGLRNTGHPATPAVQQTTAVIIVICFLTGIARSWELIGGQQIGIAGAISALLRHQRQTVADPTARSTTTTSSRAANSSTGAPVDLTWNQPSPSR